MGSGPRAGLGEIEMPHLSMGSSIMPGKTNPIIAEAVCQVAAKVIGNDATITIAGQHGNFEITATDAGPAAVERGLMMATALSTRIGYDSAAAIAREARETGRTVREVA